MAVDGSTIADLRKLLWASIDNDDSRELDQLTVAEAMPDGGRLHIETMRVVRRRPGLEVAPEQPTVVVEITDSGLGIPADSIDKIFEPFYTSKDRKGGTGLGLAVVRQIVESFHPVE